MKAAETTAKQSHYESSLEGVADEVLQHLANLPGLPVGPLSDHATVKREIDAADIDKISVQASKSPKAKKFYHDQDCLDDNICLSNDSAQSYSVVEQEIQCFLSEPNITNICPLTCWKERETSYPVLPKLAN